MYRSSTTRLHNLPGILDMVSYADMLGTAPTYHQKDAQRWNSALHIYIQMSNDDRTSRASSLNDENKSPCFLTPPVKKSSCPHNYKNSLSFFSDRFASTPSLLHPPREPEGPSSLTSPQTMPLGPVQIQSSKDDPSEPRKLFDDRKVVAEEEMGDSNQARRSSAEPMAHRVSDDVDDSPPIATSDDGLSVPPINYEWRNIHSYNSLYKPDAFPFMSALPTGRYGFMTPPVRPRGMVPGAFGHTPRGAMSLLVSPTESSLNSLELEAIAAVHELQFVVKDIFVSELLPRTSELIFLNATTLEGQAYCIELTVKGWRVTSLRHDCMNGDYNRLDLHTRYYETIYALMDNISVGYRRKFHEALSAKLMMLLVESNNQSPSPDGDAKHLPSQNDAAAKSEFMRDENVHFSIDGGDRE